MKAENIFHLSSSPAPKEWEEIKEIKEAKPDPKGAEISLSRLDGTNICMWYKRTQVFWNPCSDPFIVNEEKSTNNILEMYGDCELGLFDQHTNLIGLYTLNELKDAIKKPE